MPRRLLERCRPDSIGGFVAAAEQRHHDGNVLAMNGRRTAAIYLWGYAVEMLLKAAYFRAVGFPSPQPITFADLRSAAARAPTLGVVWSGNFHDLRAWADLLIAHRAATSGLGYGSVAFATQLAAQARGIQTVWRETLRYHKNIAYLFEMRDARAIVEWFMAYAAIL